MLLRIIAYHQQKILWPANIFDIKLYEEIRKLTTGKGEDYTTGCLLDYEYVRNHQSLIRRKKN